MGKKKVQCSLFADNMIINIENSRQKMNDMKLIDV
jgi:hypothetical protein